MVGLADDWKEFYTFEIDSYRNYAVWRYGSSFGWIRLASGSSSYINGGTATNRLKIERNGSLLEAYANGQLLTSVSEGSYTGSRHVGLVVSSYSERNVDVRFDNFAVYPVGCEVGSVTLGEAPQVSQGRGVEMPPSGSWEKVQNRRRTAP